MLNVKVLTAKASIGDPVKNKQGEDLGEIKDILFDPDTLDIEYAVLDFNKGEKEFAIPFYDLDFIGEKGFFEIQLSRENLKGSKRRLEYHGKSFYSC